MDGIHKALDLAFVRVSIGTKRSVIVLIVMRKHFDITTFQVPR
jgi:hypothetical protein